MRNTPSPTPRPSFLREAYRARTPGPPADPLIARLDHAILSIGALAARPRFHRESRNRAGLGRHYFPDHPARRIDPAHYGVLAALAGEGMPGPSSIAIRLGLHPSTVSHHLARLEQRGLLERRPYFGDRRWRHVQLTAAGREAYETLRDARHEALAALTARWTDAERAQIVEAVARLGDAVRVHNLEAHARDLERLRAIAHEAPPERAEARRRYWRERRERERTT